MSGDDERERMVSEMWWEDGSLYLKTPDGTVTVYEGAHVTSHTFDAQAQVMGVEEVEFPYEDFQVEGPACDNYKVAFGSSGEKTVDVLGWAGVDETLAHYVNQYDRAAILYRGCRYTVHRLMGSEGYEWVPGAPLGLYLKFKEWTLVIWYSTSEGPVIWYDADEGSEQEGGES